MQIPSLSPSSTTINSVFAKSCKSDFKSYDTDFDIRVVYDEAGRPTDKILSIENITKYKSQNEELTYMAYYDSVTGLLNRNYFVRQLGGLVERAAREHNIVSVLNIDIDDFRKTRL